MKIQVRSLLSEAREVQIDEAKGEITISPGFVPLNSVFIDIAEITTSSNSGVVVERSRLQLHKNDGTIRVLTLEEIEDLPADRKFSDQKLPE